LSSLAPAARTLVGPEKHPTAGQPPAESAVGRPVSPQGGALALDFSTIPVAAHPATGSVSAAEVEPSEQPVRRLLGPGHPLETVTRDRVECDYGRPVGDVRLHLDGESQRLAHGMGARAFTVGRDIVFNTNYYQPSSVEGARLLSHEIAHVVQQTTPSDRSGTPVELEREAAIAPGSDVRHRDVGVRGSRSAPIAAQCDPLTSAEIARLDESHLRARLAANEREATTLAYSNDYQQRLSVENLQLKDRAAALLGGGPGLRAGESSGPPPMLISVRLELVEARTQAEQVTSDLPTHPENYALNFVKGVAQRLEFDQTMTALVSGGLGIWGPEMTIASQRFTAMRTSFAGTVAAAERWHSAHPAGESLGMMNERHGTALAGSAERSWDRGGWYYIPGAGAYFLTAVVATVDAAETVASFGYHDASTQVAQAYAAGDISWSEGESLLLRAAGRALLIAAITRGAGAVTSRLGVMGARAAGLAPRSLAFGAASMAFSGAATSATSLAAESALTLLLQNHFTNPAAQRIWQAGLPSGRQWAMSIALSTLLGGAAGARSIRLGNARLVGTVIETPAGRIRIAAITRDGSVVLQPEGAVPTPPPPPATIDLTFNPATGAWERPAQVGELPLPAQRPQLTAGSRPIAGATEVRMSQADYDAALGLVQPGQFADPIARTVDEVGRRAAVRAMANPRFVAALQAGNWTLAGTFFHSAAAIEVRALGASALPPGWTISAEEVLQSGAGGSRSDVLARGPGGVIREFDWKTSGRSALSYNSREEMIRHASQMSGGTLTSQGSVSWMDYIRPLWP
jgi:Domain of unknown function (DUF4157)